MTTRRRGFNSAVSPTSNARRQKMRQGRESKKRGRFRTRQWTSTFFSLPLSLIYAYAFTQRECGTGNYHDIRFASPLSFMLTWFRKMREKEILFFCPGIAAAEKFRSQSPFCMTGVTVRIIRQRVNARKKRAANRLSRSKTMMKQAKLIFLHDILKLY